MKVRGTVAEDVDGKERARPLSMVRLHRIARIRRIPRWAQVMGVLLLLTGSAVAYRVYDYTEHDPNFCRSCHIMQHAWDRWATSEHRKVNCHSCHQQSKLRSLEQVWLTIVKRPEKVGPHGHVSSGVCAKCHLSGDPKWEQVGATAGHKVHLDQAKVPCWRCHAKSIHRFRPPAEICKDCHQKQLIQIAGMGRLHCTNCHNYLATNAGLLPTRDDCLWCHQKQLSAQVKFTPKSPMQFECQSCHNPHQKQSPTASCGKCHEKVFQATNQLTSGSAHRDCGACHRPHTWNTNGEQTCRSCHNPLPKVDAHVEGHKILQCNECHRPHSWRAETNGLCRTCHRRATTFSSESPIAPAGQIKTIGRGTAGPGTEGAVSDTSETEQHNEVKRDE